MPKCHSKNVERRAQVLERVMAGELKAVKAAYKLGVTPRQLYRLRDRLLTDGLAGLQPKHKGRPGCGFTHELRDRVIDLIHLYYRDFGPTMAAEKLAERHDIVVSREWLRKVMIKAGIWQDRLERAPRVHQLRQPLERRGELVQIDGSHHRWFEDRGKKCALLVFIDDATSELLHLEFAPSESAMAYMKAAVAYMERHGKPIAFYSDKHSVFRKANPNRERSDDLTQFGTALSKLKVGMINAESAQAKGRVERANRTLQDRMVKEMRLRGISTIDAANAYAREYIEAHNKRFARPAANPLDAHRPLESAHELREALRWETPRRLTATLTITYDKRIFVLEPSRRARSASGRNVTVCEYPDGRVEIEYEGTPLPYQVTFDKLRRIDPAIVSRKLLEPALDEIREELVQAKGAEHCLPLQTPPTAIRERLDAAFAMAVQLQEQMPHHRRRNRASPARIVPDGGLFPEVGHQGAGTSVSPQDDGTIPRKLSKQLTFQHACVGYCVDDTPDNRALIGEYLNIKENDVGGVIEVTFGDRTIHFGLRSDRTKANRRR